MRWSLAIATICMLAPQAWADAPYSMFRDTGSGTLHTPSGIVCPKDMQLDANHGPRVAFATNGVTCGGRLPWKLVFQAERLDAPLFGLTPRT